MSSNEREILLAQLEQAKNEMRQCSEKINQINLALSDQQKARRKERLNETRQKIKLLTQELQRDGADIEEINSIYRVVLTEFSRHPFNK